MPNNTLTDEALIPISQQVTDQVGKAFGFPYYVNDITTDANFDLKQTPTKLELEVDLIADPQINRSISFYSDASGDPVLGTATAASAVTREDLTFLYLNDGFKDSYLIIIKDGKVAQNLKLEQQILSGPEVEMLVDNITPQLNKLDESTPE